MGARERREEAKTRIRVMVANFQNLPMPPLFQKMRVLKCAILQ